MSGWYANKIEKKRARREVYRTFLTELIEIIAQISELRDLMFNAPLVGRDSGTIRTGLAKLAAAPSRLRLHELGVRLEGPSTLSVLVEAATDQVSWLEERLELTFEQNEYTNMRKTIDRDWVALHQLKRHIEEEAPRHL